MSKQFKMYFIFYLIFILEVYPQTLGEQKLLEMKNAFILGLTEKGLEIGVELMSRNEYNDVREDATFYIAELFFVLSTQAEDNMEYPSKAYTYFLVLQKDYPNSKYNSTVIKRLNTLTAYFQNNTLFRNLLDANQNEASVVKKKLEFTEKLYTFKFPDPYLVFSNGKKYVQSSEILSRYYDEIIINHPEFDIYAIYYKMISELSQFSDVDFISQGLFKFNEYKIDKETFIQTPSRKISKYYHVKSQLDSVLNNLSIKYPHHPLTLELHLIFANVFMNQLGNVIDYKIKKHLEFVVQNELDKTHPRYLLSKEFLLNNEFSID